LALQQTQGVGPVTFSKIIAQVDSLAEIFDKPSALHGVSDTIKQQLAVPNWAKVEQDLLWLEQPNCHILLYGDKQYPSLLAEIHDPPSLLYLQGDISMLSQWQLAIVGSRNPSETGRQLAYDFANYLGHGGLCITSGLAMGIDAAAHKGALAAGAKTIAVVGTGLDRVYPAKNRDLAHDIAANGLLVSEFPLGTPPKSENFPRRNRIISALSLGTLVVEAALKSGSLITARMAMEQAREVFAIPGSIHNPLARGCHKLIREGAKLVETAQDILEELGPLAQLQVETLSTGSEENEQQQELNDPEYQLLLDKLGFDPITIDELIQRSGLTAEEVSSMLLLLELKGQVESLAGGRYVRSRT
jgi:DNA processing protein